MIALPGFMFRDLRGASKIRSLWVFCACLVLGIALIAVCGSLLQLVRDGFDQQQRELYGGDLEISQRSRINNAQLDWLNDNASVSRLLELRTMLGTEDDEFSLVELQSVDDNYPLYGEVRLQPALSLTDAVKQSSDGVWGAVFDPALVETLSLDVGQRVSIGEIEVELRAMILEQPDRSLRADFRGPPLILDEGALQESGLMSPTSLIEYEYRVRTNEDPADWRDRLRAAFPDASWEVETVEERGEFVVRRLDQIASVLLLIGFSTLLIGGLGVANSVSAYLQSKLRTLATLQSLGARAPQVASVYIGQITLVSLVASTVGAVLGSAVAWLAARGLAERLPLDPSIGVLFLPTLLAIALGVFTAMAFTLPILGRTLNVPTAMLIRGIASDDTRTPVTYQRATIVVSLVALLLLLWFVPEPWVAAAFALCIVVLLLLLDGIVKLIRQSSQALLKGRLLDGHFALRMAVAGLHRPGATLRPILLSLGIALTLLVTSTQVIASMWRLLSDTVPENAPALVFYDLQKEQVQPFNELVENLEGYQTHAVTPLVLGRLTAVNDEQLRDSDEAQRSLEANDEQKLSYRRNSVDNIQLIRGEWWPENYTGPPLVAMEDREADQLGLNVGDQLQFTIMDQTLDVTLSAIYSQARFETSFWLEAVFTDAVLDPFITRHIGSLNLRSGTDFAAQAAIGNSFYNVVTIRTAKVLAASRSLLTSAAVAMILIAAVSLSASVLVMSSVVAVNRQRQVYEASILHAVGTRMSVIMKSVAMEYALLAMVVSLFAMIAGSVLAHLLLTYWLKVDGGGTAWTGAVVAISASSLCLLGGALWLMITLRVSPAILLKRGA